MLVKKEDLLLHHYSWNDQVEQRDDLNPTRKTFDRNNGTHVLWVVNWFATASEQFNKEDIAKLESLISDKLPFGLLSEKSVCQWLMSN